jgi:hypothetical protein
MSNTKDSSWEQEDEWDHVDVETDKRQKKGRIHEIVSKFNEIAATQAQEPTTEVSNFGVNYDLRHEFAQKLHQNRNTKPTLDMVILMYLFEILCFTSPHSFTIHGGVLRDIVDGKSPVDFDIKFWSMIRMFNFIEFLTTPWNEERSTDFKRYTKKSANFQSFEKMCTKLISCVPKQEYANENCMSLEYEVKIAFLGKTITLDLVHFNGDLQNPPDFTVNTLGISENGCLTSNVKDLSIETIFDHIKEKKLSMVDQNKWNYWEFFSDLIKKNPEFVSKYQKKIAEVRIPKMLNKGYKFSKTN